MIRVKKINYLAVRDELYRFSEVAESNKSACSAAFWKTPITQTYSSRNLRSSVYITLSFSLTPSAIATHKHFLRSWPSRRPKMWGSKVALSLHLNLRIVECRIEA